MPFWLFLIIIVSIVGGLGFAAFATWLDYQSKNAKAGASDSALAETVAAQQKLLEAAEQRIQNLEAIVTSEAWDAQHGAGLSDAEPTALGQPRRIDASLFSDAPDPTERAQQMARRARS